MKIRIHNLVYGMLITFLDKYNPEQFEILEGSNRYGILDTWEKNADIQKQRSHGNNINNKATYFRVYIRKKGDFNMLIQPYVLPVGSKLYRFINKEPEKVNFGMTPNEGKDGRFNKYSNIYYCSKSINGLLQEYGFNKIQGSLIVSVVQEPIILGMPVDEEIVPIIRGRTKDEPPEMVHDMIHKKFENDKIIDYELTSQIAEWILAKYPNGFCYPSVHSVDTVKNGYIFQVDEDTGFSNIALSESGYKKIKEEKPEAYFYKGD